MFKKCGSLKIFGQSEMYGFFSNLYDVLNQESNV